MLSNRLCYKTECHGWRLVTEPPVTIGEDLSKYREKPLCLNYPCHSQTVEHGMATTSKVALTSTDYEKQLGAAFAIVNSRKKIMGRMSRKRMRENFN